MEKKLKDRLIGFGTIGIALIAFCLSFNSTIAYDEGVLKVNFFTNVFSIIHFSFFVSEFYEVDLLDNDNYVNLLNIGFYLILFLGGLFYLTSRQKESRLLAFCSSIVFIVCVTSLLFALPGLFPDREAMERFPSYWLYQSIGIVRNTLFGFLSFRILKEIRNQHEPVINYEELGGTTFEHYVPASRWQRFFHFGVDIVVGILIYSAFAAYLARALHLENMEDRFGERTTVWIFLLFVRLIYYGFFEVILGSTPGKYLTETQVLTLEGEKPGRLAMFLRTIIRLVPFEPWSFFGYGWHDTWTRTQVVCQKRKGIKGGYYFLILPAVAIMCFGVYFGKEKYEDHQSYLRHKQEYDQNIKIIKERLQNVSTDLIINLEDQAERYSERNYYLKVEEVKQATVSCTMFSIRDRYDVTPGEIQTYYESEVNDTSRIEVDKGRLLMAYAEDYDQSLSEKWKGFDVFGNGGHFEIIRIDKMDEPVLKEGSSKSIQGDMLSLTVTNQGGGALIQEIRNVEGDLQWVNSFPQWMDRAEARYNRNYAIVATGYSTGKHYKFQIIIKDIKSRTQVYEMEGENLNTTFTRVQ
jgi:hypothetical protein